MKAYYIIIGLFVLFCSCSSQKRKGSNNTGVYDTIFERKQIIRQKEDAIIDLDSIKNKIIASKASSGNANYQFYLEDVGTEGNEGTAFYSNDSLRKVEVNIYTSMWKVYLLYLFDDTHIKVTERTYNIYDSIELVKMKSYTMDFKGVPLEKVDSARVDIFPALKRVVPFTLK